MEIHFDTPIAHLPTVGPQTEKHLKRLGLRTVRDLLFYFPYRYEDLRLVKRIAELSPHERVTIRARVDLIQNKRSPQKRMILTEAIVRDASGVMKVIWFRQPFLTKIIHPGDELFLSGKTDFSYFTLELLNPTFEKVKEIQLHTARVVPLYPLTSGVSHRQIRFLVERALFFVVRKFPDPLPAEIRTRQRLLDLQTALREIHFPRTVNLLKAARTRLKFDELFLIQLHVLLLRHQRLREHAPIIPFQEKPTKQFVDRLPFSLTQAQRKAAWEILKDLEKPIPMNRLLEGDVGSGKTVVAAIAALNVARAGFQTAWMAPTEILAEQHFQNLSRFFKKTKLSIGLLTSGIRRISGKEGDVKRSDLTKQIERGAIDLLIGTHALIQDKVVFRRLAFAIIDEQHRFGVDQRQKLREKNPAPITWFPHLLSMTATPIPRSLALTIYGDLDLSILDEMPKGRKRVITKLVPSEKRDLAYEFIRKEINDNRRVLVVCPLIEESDKLGVKAATTEYERLTSSVFPDLPIGILHGRMKTKGKEQVMRDFLTGKLKILVATPVVEVGIDVPNATIMMIEDAERFGLAQLHQFRGRVGRSVYQSYCFLFTENSSEEAKRRLLAFVDTNDGFRLAEEDLKFRGPGEMFGSKQSGYFLMLKIAKLTDYELIRRGRTEAERLFQNDPTLALSPLLKQVMQERFGTNPHLE